MLLDVVIVNYNVKRYLYQCLRSVEAAIEGMDADVWVVDNNSKDGSIDFLKPLFPKVHFLCNEENVGFSKANNKAIRLSNGRYVLLLNPDTLVTTGAIRKSVKWLEEHDDAGSVGVAQHNVWGTFAWESRRGVPTPLVSFCKMSGLSKLFPNHPTIGRYYMRFLDRNKPSEIEILSGAYMMLRREALDKVGLLDEDFFMYGEDVDLSYRLLKGGWKNYYLPEQIIHYKGESEHPSTVRYVNVFHQAMIIFYEKHFKKRHLLSGLLIRMAVYAKAFLTLIKQGINKLFSRFRKADDYTHFYCYASDSHKAEIERLVKETDCDVDFLSEGQLPTGMNDGDSFLFDSTIYSYDTMIKHIVACGEKKPRVYLSTFDPQIGIVLP